MVARDVFRALKPGPLCGLAFLGTLAMLPQEAVHAAYGNALTEGTETTINGFFCFSSEHALSVAEEYESSPEMAKRLARSLEADHACAQAQVTNGTVGPKIASRAGLNVVEIIGDAVTVYLVTPAEWQMAGEPA